jgi:G3E family GTPase
MLVDGDMKLIELTNGCICCTIQLDLKKQIDKIVQNYKPRWLYIETTGLADPIAIVDLLTDYVHKGGLKSLKVISIVDCNVWPMRKILGPVFIHQLAAADLILINKIDMINHDRLNIINQQIAYDFPQAQIEFTNFCQGDHEKFRSSSRLNGKKEVMSFFHSYIPTNKKEWKALTFTEPQALDENRFKKFLTEHRNEIFRIKGVVKFKDRSNFINHVNGSSQWRITDWEKETNLTIIGKNINPEIIIKDLKSCINSTAHI